MKRIHWNDIAIWSLTLSLFGNHASAQSVPPDSGTDRPSVAATATEPAHHEAAQAVDIRPVQILANWTGSADMTTESITVSAGDLELAWLAIPKGPGPSSLTVVVYDDANAKIHTITSGALTMKRLERSRVCSRTAPARVRLAVMGQNVLWGVWAQVRSNQTNE
jgi:hypothetical protein